MKFVDLSHRIPIKSWCEHVEAGAWEQAVNLTKLPFVYHHVALMADCHEGFGMPVGGVIGCAEALIPNAVGVDIGCGMCAVQTSLSYADAMGPKDVARILHRVKKIIPTGFAHHRDKQHWSGFGDAPDIAVIQQELSSAMYQLGTLGGGNHFIEIQRGSDGKVWIMIHSGSRNFGYKIAGAYHKKALAYCSRRDIDLPDRDLAWLPLDSAEAREYLTAMDYALRFAYENRQNMKEKIRGIFAEEAGATFVREIDIHHNYAAVEKHFGKELIVHRKGATRAACNITGIIPGSMGSASYIVRGLGNPESFESSAHGAGRLMGRREANRRLTVDEARAAMRGIVYNGFVPRKRGEIDLSEAPQAYKNIDEVIAAQSDLVSVEMRLVPIGVLKG